MKYLIVIILNASLLANSGLTSIKRNKEGCYDLKKNKASYDRLVLGGVERLDLESGLLRCVSPHARFYLRTDLESVVFIDKNGILRTSHLNSAIKNKNRVKHLKSKLKIAKARRDEISYQLKIDPTDENKALLSKALEYIDTLKKNIVRDRLEYYWHQTFANVAKVTGRIDH